MKEKHVILRSTGAATRDLFLGPAVAPNAAEVAAGLAVEVDEIDRRNIPTLTRNGDVLAVAPVIPMRLIAPLEHR